MSAKQAGFDLKTLKTILGEKVRLRVVVDGVDILEAASENGNIKLSEQHEEDLLNAAITAIAMQEPQPAIQL